MKVAIQRCFVKKLRSSKTSNPADNIDPHEWHEWFKNLNSTPITSSDAEKSIGSLVRRAKHFAASNHLLDRVINDEEIIKASKRLQNGKSIGNDAICNEMIKCLVHTKFIDVIRMLFNAILTRTYFPSSWKVNYIIPVFKSDDSFNPNNYRGISVSSCLGKLFTLVINERLIKFLDIENTLSSFQIGFRRGYRTSDHVFVLNTIINSYFSKGKKAYACFVDFSKAYDSVWRKGLLYKLILNGLSFQFISLIDSMYSELKAAVKLSNGITPFFNSAVGLRQGCNLSPLLFNIFVNDIFDIFDDLKCCPVKLNNKPITSLMYADDLLILSETEDGLKKSLQRLGKYAKQWKMKINAKNTKIMVFNKQGRKSDMKVKLDDLVIESCEQYYYLGTVFTPRNNFKTAQNELYKKACRAFFGYLKDVNIRAGAQITTVSKLFNSLVAPILLYNCEIWGAFINNKKLQRVDSFIEKMFDNKNKHELLQLKMAKIALGIHKKSNNMAVRGELGLYPLNIDIYIRMTKYFLHLKDLVVKGNKVIEDGITESINLVRNRHECWLASVLFIFKTVGIDFDLNQLLVLENEDIIKEVKDKCRRTFEVFQ